MGAVVGATEPEHIARLRELMPRSVFLIPGVGAQGGEPELLGAAFAAGPAAAIVAASRAIAGAPDPAAAAERTARRGLGDFRPPDSGLTRAATISRCLAPDSRHPVHEENAPTPSRRILAIARPGGGVVAVVVVVSGRRVDDSGNEVGRGKHQPASRNARRHEAAHEGRRLRGQERRHPDRDRPQDRRPGRPNCSSSTPNSTRRSWSPAKS